MAARAQKNCRLVAFVGEMHRAWCVAEYVVLDATNAVPPVSFLIVATKLSEVFQFVEANRNSEWRKIITDKHAVETIIHMIGDKEDCFREQARRVNTATPRPRANLHGHNNYMLISRLICSNGKTYDTQAQAASELGMSQSHISRHLRGELRHVKGYTFTRVEEQPA